MIPALLARLDQTGRTWDQMRRDSREAAAVIRGLLQQNGELAVRSKEIVGEAEKLDAAYKVLEDAYRAARKDEEMSEQFRDPA